MDKRKFVKKDKKTEAMTQFIRDFGVIPVDPDIEFEGYSKNRFGKLGEQYIECIFKELNIQKIEADTKPTPDFRMSINGKQYIMEVKSVSNLYKTFWGLVEKICEGQKKSIKDLAMTIYENYDVSLTPFEIHEEDYTAFEDKILSVIKEFDLKKTSIKTEIKCSKANYKIEIKKKRKKIKGIYSTGSGWLPKEANTLANFISKKKQQIGKCDILSIILLNDSINYTDLEGLFYRTTMQLLHLFSLEDEEDGNEDMFFFQQLDLDNTIWGTEFKNKDGKTTRIGDRLKCILVFYPEQMTAYVFPSVKLFANFSVNEYTILKETIKGKGFDLYFASHKVEAKRVQIGGK